MEIKKGDLVILGIDYFTRKIFGKSLKSKESYKILEFIREVHSEFPISNLITDNGREFDNEALNVFCQENDIKRTFSVPYYHQSNGRIERANRTIRDGLKHAKGPTRKVLSNVISSYNETHHRGIGMSPNDATKRENEDKVLTHQEKYAEEFMRKYSKYDKYEVNDKVLIKKEIKTSKMDNEFEELGRIEKIVGNDVYELKVGDSKLTRHASQLKRLSGGMLDVEHPVSNIPNEQMSL